MRPKVYIDGHVGTTGLRIRQWLADRDDLELLTLSDADRKNSEARREQALRSDVTVLCLPDDAAREVAAWTKDSEARLIDASTAHRVAEGWVYGLPELAPTQRDAIRSAKNVSNGGCYAASFILLTRPLVDAGLLRSEAPLSIHALSGYTGGGKSLIEKWEGLENGYINLPYEAPYALERVHKHIPEMTAYSKLQHPPQFIPAVGPYACGMRVEIPLHAALDIDSQQVWEAYQERYHDEPFVNVVPFQAEPALNDFSLDPQACNDTNRIDLHVIPNREAGHTLLVAILDNLGKGASGMAIQSLNLMLGVEEVMGLTA
ncbi:MAG: N-acetyl-gamma-glutamyl-phosphate reductase [Pseudomonadota bacterium]